ncbi:MAG: dienelactone hydrolase family protein [Saprospiraceae bacterium]|nr:dienelactone hydrolase family protein [Saprospiraceae bacterium]MCF8249084.1 dienelactone hydrolase family protein [Saprospiraceae bacterium]MCF8280951.1 dienelactone hydrolase family protein [Bacteroidales bacterium]MCF8311106.1 dienelactone hydrolase family protein [Saprospiraceae bacterium]MCF8440196.1 dienelactone hydrolase family protein [Saprospiraceae bacterium]
MKNFSLFCFAMLAIFAFTSCTNDTVAEKSGEAMSIFASDTSFSKLHETPQVIDYQGKGTMLDLRTTDGGMTKVYVNKTAEPTQKFLFVIHEWWGLNDHIKQEADRLFDDLGNVTVVALDLYDGKVTADPDEAGKIMGSVKPERSEAIIKGALAYAGKDGQVATIGWCFGGGWSLRTSILAAERGVGCVMYYGMPVEKATELAPIQVDVLGIFAKQDKWINEDVVTKFETLAKATGKKVENHWFNADHAFANPSSPRYNEAAAQEANALALAFLRKKLGD